LDVGSNKLARTEPKNILEAAKTMSSAEKGWINPFGNGKTAEAIIEIILEKN
jgi:UDP-N-acetylglucosamine 2-epimerase